jgi:hypothetical protein
MQNKKKGQKDQEKTNTRPGTTRQIKEKTKKDKEKEKKR